MKYSIVLSSALALASFAKAQQPEYYQCGGIGWTGATTCVSPYVCTYENAYYSQCLPGTATTTTTKSTTTSTTTSKTTTTTSTTSKTTTTTTTTSSSSSKTTTTTKTSAIVAPSGFVSTASSPSPHFVLDGKPFYWSGTNAYFAPQIDEADAVSVFQTMQSLGLTVVRIWMFNEVTAAQTYGAYYHLWSGGTATFNLGPYGFDRMDYILSLAEQYGIKVILTLTNNWSDYGGSDVYVKQLGYTYHDQFYTEAAVISAFKTYVDFVIGRYGGNSTVFGWELMNEPRCSGSGGLPTSSSCNSSVLTAWVDEMSTYIHSIDSNHIVGVGDEGFFCWTNTTDYIYDCGTGGDSNAYSKLSGIDFLTFHMYPESWGEESPSVASWGSLWIEQHAFVQQASGKPTILEEFGTQEANDASKYPIYSAWYQSAEQYNLAGVAYWQLGNADTEVIDYTQSDADTVFCPSYTNTCGVISAFSTYQAAKN